MSRENDDTTAADKLLSHATPEWFEMMRALADFSDRLGGLTVPDRQPSAETTELRVAGLTPARLEQQMFQRATRLMIERKLAEIEGRNRWLYDQAMMGIKWSAILERLRLKHPEWEPLGSIQSIRAAVQRYAKKNHLPLPKKRK